jgi:hypothetical protein
VLKLDSYEVSYTLADTMIADVDGKVQFTLPVDSIISHTGLWKVSLCNNREPVKQSLSKALRPKADL